MNVLYFKEQSQLLPSSGGVGNVAYHLTRALSEKVNLTSFPKFIPQKTYAVKLLNIYTGFVKKDFDIIHFNSSPIWVNGGNLLFGFAKISSAATLLNIHGIIQMEYMINHLTTKKFRTAMEKSLLNTLMSCKRADQIVVNSEYMRNNVVIWYGINRKKIAVIPNGVDLKLFTDSNERITLDGEPSVLYVGHLTILKGIDVLIQAIAKLRPELPNIKLHIVGGGNINYFKLLAKEEGIEKHVVFHGWTERSRLPRYYKSADICIFPSRHEGFGIVIIEAMASGIPVIASNIPSFQEIISDGRDGRLFKSEDPDDLSKQVISLYQDSQLRKEFLRNGFETAQKFSWDNIADKYVYLYKCLRE